MKITCLAHSISSCQVTTYDAVPNLHPPIAPGSKVVKCSKLPTPVIIRVGCECPLTMMVKVILPQMLIDEKIMDDHGETIYFPPLTTFCPERICKVHVHVHQWPHGKSAFALRYWHTNNNGYHNLSNASLIATLVIYNHGKIQFYECCVIFNPLKFVIVWVWCFGTHLLLSNILAKKGGPVARSRSSMP